MGDNVPLTIAMAEACRDLILAREQMERSQPASLQPRHLHWMCTEIIRHAGDWPAAKLHRWLGFVQGAMIANHMIDLAAAKTMFDRAKSAYGEADEDLLDHLNPDSTFEIELGGQG